MVTERRELQGERLSRISSPKRQVQTRVRLRQCSSVYAPFVRHLVQEGCVQTVRRLLESAQVNDAIAVCDAQGEKPGLSIGTALQRAIVRLVEGPRVKQEALKKGEGNGELVWTA